MKRGTDGFSLLLGAVLLCALRPMVEAAAHRLHIYPNQSLIVNAIVQSPDGFLWLAAADGLYRFDGFHYHKIDSFPFKSARALALTRDGSLWCGGLEGLARLRNARFEIVLKEEVASLVSYPDQLFVRLHLGLARIGLDGSVRGLNHLTRKDLLIDSAARLWGVCVKPERGCWLDPSHPETLHPVAIPESFEELVPAGPDKMWAADEERAVLLDHGRAVETLERHRSRERDRPGPLLAGRGGRLWFLGETVRSLTSPLDFRDRASHNRFAPNAGFEDSRGHLWVAAAGQGLVEWIEDAPWQRWFPEDYRGELAAQVLRSQEGSMILATQKNLYRLDASGETWRPLTDEEQRYYALAPLAGGGFLASSGKSGFGQLRRLSADGQAVEHLRDLLPAPDDYREILRDGKGRLWVGTKRALLRIEGSPGSFHLRSETGPQGQFDDAVDLELDAAGRLWTGYGQGIAWLDDRDRWHKLSTDQPVTMVRSFALAGDDIWVSHRQSGYFSLLHRQGDRWHVTRFSASAGYTPMDTQFIKLDSRGWIWRGADDGVHISDGSHFAPEDWIHLHLANGLATNETGQYSFFEDADRSVWIAGEDGVAHLRPSPSWFDAPHTAPAPRVTRVEADGRVYLAPETPPPALPPGTRVLRIDVGTLDASPFRDSPLRYRLRPLTETWQLSRDGTLEFRNLPDDAYTLEVGFTGNGASAVSAYPFRLGAGGSTFPWSWTIGLVVGAGALFAGVRHVPALDKTRFRIEKALFVMRRRFSRQRRSSQGTVLAGPDYTGETLSGRYRLSRIVSRGGFSVVYEARDLRAGGGRLAVKVLRKTGEASWLRDRFAHEVAALGSVDHPGVVPILDSWISPEGEPCLAMPFLEGKTLRAALRHAPFPVPRAARIIEQMAAALAEVHSHGIVHRDLKPENVVLCQPETDRERPVIIDFGTAGLRTADNELAATTLMSGSFHYMAPERLTGHYSPASDIFSLGVMILEMLTGKRLADLHAMFSDPSFPVELENTLRANLGEGQAKTVAECLAPAYDLEPRRRPASVKPWAEEMAAALAGGSATEPRP